MKIAITGGLIDENKKILKAFLKQWQNYLTPKDTIYDNDIKWPENDKDLEKLKESLNPIEQILFAKVILMNNQYDKYAEQKNMIYLGSPLDVLANTLLYSEKGFLSDIFVEKIFYYTKKLVKKFDAIYWRPDFDLKDKETKDGEDISDDDKLEMIFNNIYENYHNHLEESVIFDKEDCPGILPFDSDNYIAEFKYILDEKGNLLDDDVGLQDTDKLFKLLGNNEKLKEAAKIGLTKDKNSTIKI